ncbi:hypothetical protein DRW41_08600 [Neobacillus piezotolerans]|uniref:Uncharacterized protein n=1 Tax=Neobacillus piezotolerans TaxID=2259171 RepID=A0A3D8GV02_9BACI|nr:hypothetical protein [Neobacillus piezotolerans]RDU37866.1 hypothetical protein DRW41_08600 [Neobacillus piezotolerans]
MVWLLVSLLGLILIVGAIFFFVHEAKSLENKAMGTYSFLFDLVFSFIGGAILLGLLLFIFGLAKAVELL